MDETLFQLIDKDADEFDAALESLHDDAVGTLITMLQSAIPAEKARYEMLNQRINESASGGGDGADAADLIAQSVLSQSRFTQLCSKNVKCLAKNAARIGLLDEPTTRKSLSAKHRERKEQQSNGVSAAKKDVPPDEAEIRLAVESVLSELIENRVKQEAPHTPELVRIPLSQLRAVLKDGGERQTTPKPSKAVDRRALLDSQDSILAQVRRARQSGVTPKSPTEETLVDYSDWSPSVRTTTPLKSILKKPSAQQDDDMTETSDSIAKITTAIYSPPRYNPNPQRIIPRDVSTFTASLTSKPVNSPPVSHSSESADTENGDRAATDTAASHTDPDEASLKETDTRRAPSHVVTLPPITPPYQRTRVDILAGGVEQFVAEENAVCRDWDPHLLIDALYKVDYAPRSDVKRAHFRNMEGHLEHLPLGVKVALFEKQWKDHYFRTKEGRLYWYQTPYADELSAIGEVLLAGADIELNEDEMTLLVRGGKQHSHLLLRCPSALLDKWRQALLSHAASSVGDSYVQPLYPPVANVDERVVIIELGSCSIRAGFLTTEPSLPQLFMPAVAAVLPNQDVVVGVDALRPAVRRDGTVLQPIRPTQPGLDRYTVDVAVVRKMLQHVFGVLGVDAPRYKALLSVPQNTPTALVGELLRVLLTEMGVSAAAVARHPCLVLYSYDVTTGVVVDFGDRLNIVPVVDGYVVENAIQSLPYGGTHISDSMRAKLCEQNMGLYTFMSIVQKYILRYIVEQTCYVAVDYDEEVSKYGDKPDVIDTTVDLEAFEPTPEMPKQFRVDAARFTSSEGLLKPKRWGLDLSGLQRVIFNAIQLSPMDSRRVLYRNIYLSGGASLLPGLAERLEVELGRLVAPSVHVQVHVSPWRYHAAYLGAQVVAASSLFGQTVVTEAELPAFLQRLHASNF